MNLVIEVLRIKSDFIKINSFKAICFLIETVRMCLKNRNNRRFPLKYCELNFRIGFQIFIIFV